MEIIGDKRYDSFSDKNEAIWAKIFDGKDKEFLGRVFEMFSWFIRVAMERKMGTFLWDAKDKPRCPHA